MSFSVIQPWSLFNILLWTFFDYLFMDMFKNAWGPVSVCLSHDSPRTPVKKEAWKLASIILTKDGSKVTDQIFDILPTGWNI